MMFNFLKRIVNILLIPPLLFFANEVLGQCDIEIVDGSIVVIDYEPGVEFQFDIYNGSSLPYEGGTLYMAWTLSSSDPIWEFELLTPIEPGESMTVTTPKLDMPAVWPGELNMFTAPDNQPTSDNPWLESNDWFFYTQPFPYPGPLGNGNWVPIRLYLDNCTLFDADIIIDENGDFYYGPQVSGCVNDVPDQFCDLSCDFEILDFNETSFTLQVNGSECYNLNQFPKEETLNSFISTFSYGSPVICTGNINYNYFEPMVSGDIQTFDYYEYSNGGAYGCLEQIIAGLENDCEVTIGVGNPNILSPSLNINDFLTIQGEGLCEIPLSSPDANPTANLNSTTCLDGSPANIYNIIINNYGEDTLFYYCVEIPELNYNECFDGYDLGQFWIEPGGGQSIGEFTISEDIEQITINVYEAEGETEGTFSNNVEIFPIVFNGPDPCPILGCTDPNANNYDPEADEEDGSCTYNELTLDLGGDIIWTPQGSCVDPFYNQSFVVNNTGEGVIDNFSLEVVVETWDGDLIYEGTQDYNVSIDPNGSYTVSDFPDMFTGDLNYVTATLTWINELGDIETSIQTFNLILYCWGCTDPEANNYVESEYIFDEIQTHWLIAFPNTLPPTPEQIECTYDIVDVALDTVLYDTGCDENGPYWSPTFYLTNEGDFTITELCIVPDILSTPEIDTVCFNNLNILPGETFLQEWPNIYDWGVLSVRIIDVNGESGESWNDFGFDEDVADNMYVQIISDIPDCTEGCTDPNAINYNPNAIIDDGSCLYDVLGCTDPNALNYDPQATVDDGSCEYDILGCTDPLADNYNSNATLDDGSCEYLGCTDPEANNYNPNANLDDGSCTYDVLGCTDNEALNYNPNANIDDGTCIYPSYDPCDEFDGNAFAPNVFTPNNDGLNDAWRVITEVDCWNKWELIIYNRWGQVVYDMDNPSQVWDGSYRGGDYYVSDGVYAYTLRAVAWNLKTIELTGSITILR